LSRYLVDSNACIEFMRGRNQALLARWHSYPATDICLCSVVISELLFGALRSAKVTSQLLAVSNFALPYQSLPFDGAAANHHSRIRAELAQKGISIGPHDSQIAAIALANNLTVVTHNVSEFSRVPGLTVEDWHV
jgi:tRNA(fMet)-specific endonuclease VapC